MTCVVKCLSTWHKLEAQGSCMVGSKPGVAFARIEDWKYIVGTNVVYHILLPIQHESTHILPYTKVLQGAEILMF